MKEALHGSPVEDFPIPEGVVLVPVDLSMAGTCARPVMIAFISGTEPRNNCGPKPIAPKPEGTPGDAAPPLAPPAGAAPTASGPAPRPTEQGQ